MKITTKLTICFVILTVLPLAAASFMYLRSTNEFSLEMAERGKTLLSDRLTRELRRVTEQGAITLVTEQKQMDRAVRAFASNVTERMTVSVSELSETADLGEFSLHDQNLQGSQTELPIDLYKMGSFIAADSAKDQIAGTLYRLIGITDVARTVYQRNRTFVDSISVSFESGLTLSYPAGVTTGKQDPRESDWYFRTIERGATSWFTKGEAVNRRSVTTPVQTSSGQIVGVARIIIRTDALLTKSINPTHLPPEASAYLIAVPDDEPQLLPNEVAVLEANTGNWRVHDLMRPMLLDGDDAWLKVASDIRSGVPGMEFVTRSGVREAWSFGPLGRTEDVAWHLAATFPEQVITSAQDQAEAIVRASYQAQLRNAVIFAVFAGISAIGLAIYGARTLTKPIRQLHAAATQLETGDFSTRVDDTSSDELGDLAREFNRLVPALEEQVRVKRDLLAAQEIQQHFVPSSAPAIDGFDIASTTIYCDEIGGDYQDFIPMDDERIAAIIGDVTGHGISAALLMVTARAMIRTYTDFASSPADLFDSVNRQLCEDSSGGRSLTLFQLLLTPGQHRFTWISAGHEPALVYDIDSNAFTALDGEDIPLGVDQSWSFRNMSGTFPKNGILIAYTDGICEASNAAGEAYGLDRLKATVEVSKSHSSQAISEALLKDLETFRGAIPVKDDVSLLVVKTS